MRLKNNLLPYQRCIKEKIEEYKRSRAKKIILKSREQRVIIHWRDKEDAK